MKVHELDERQRASVQAFLNTPEGAWMLEALVVGNYVLDPFPGGLSEWERGVCEGRRQVVLEILDMFQLGYQGAYEVINRVERMAKDEAGKESYAND